MVSEIPSDRPIAKTPASSDKAPSQASVRLSKVQAEVSSSVKIAVSQAKTDSTAVAQELSAKSATIKAPSRPASPPPSVQSNPPKALYNATVVFNRPADAATSPAQNTSTVTQLTIDVIQRINQGLMTVVRVTTDLPLLKGDQLIVNSSPTLPNKAPGTSATAPTPHLELQQLNSVSSTQRTQQTITNLVRLLVPRQNSYSPLLNNILSLASDKPELLKQLSPNIQQAIKHISQHLPNSESLRTANTVKQAIKHSGVLFESSLKAEALNPEPRKPEALQTGLIKHGQPRSELLKSEILSPEQLKESLKYQSPEAQSKKYQSPLASTTATNSKQNISLTTTNTTTRTNATSQLSSPNNTNPSSPSDFKHQLLSLEKALLSATKTTSTKPILDATTTNDPSKIIQKTATTTNPTTGTPPTLTTSASVPTNSSITSSTTVTTHSYAAPSEKQQLQNLMLSAKAQQASSEALNIKHQANNVKSNPEPAINIKTPSASNTNSPTPPLAIQTYQTASSPNTASLQGIPPLPGQHLIQAQTNIKATLNADVVADALVKILLKQTQEAISRLQLHQLSTAAAHVDEGVQVTQPPLSFDLPILHFGQLTLFHFHIEEEAQKREAEKETSADKKWSVSMGFDIEGLGAMFCELSLINTHVYVKFWAKEKETVYRAKTYFDVLQKNLSQIGATVKELECIEGLPPQQESSITPSLIDIET